MCGINGFCFSTPESVEKNDVLINEMNNRIIHRGPDQDGTFSNASAAVGMRRLSIIDLSTGKQPISNEKGNLRIVFNGEIYNFRELKEELITLGHSFSTGSDTEVIVHAYEQYGKDCPKKIKGMFAFAIYNKFSNAYTWL